MLLTDAAAAIVVVAPDVLQGKATTEATVSSEQAGLSRAEVRNTLSHTPDWSQWLAPIA